MVVLKKFTSAQFLSLENIAGRILYDSSLKTLRFNDSANYNNILVFKDLDNNVTGINNLTINGNINIANHNRLNNTGLQLGGTLVTANANELNYTQVTPGMASANKALVLDSDLDIENINTLVANTIMTNNLTTQSVNTGTINTTGNVGINTTALDFALEVNHSIGNCLRLSYNDNNGSPQYKCDFTLTPTGSLMINPTGNNPSVVMNSNISGVSLSLTKQNVSNNTIDLPLSLTVLPDTVSANGLGSGIEFNSLNSAFTIFTLGTFEAYSTNIIDNSETAAYRWRLANNGALTTIANLSSEGLFSCITVSATHLIETSDIRLKTDIKTLEIDYSVDKILQLNPKKYKFKQDLLNDKNKERYGFIAQDLKEVMPNLVEITETENIEDLHHINYTGLIPHLVNCIKDLYSELSNLKTKISN